MERHSGRLFFVPTFLLMILGFYTTVNGNDMYSSDSFGFNTTNHNLSKPGYKPVPDRYLLAKEAKGSIDNFLYREWCKETFDNGEYVYEAYKNIAFNIEYTPEPEKTDIWQTPLETTRLKKGDCEDAVFHFFSQLPSNQKNAEIIWGWVINNQDGIGRAHVWYQLTDKGGQQYVVEGFSKEWNGIIPMGIVKNTETRIPIFTIVHSSASRLANSPLEIEDIQSRRSFSQFINPLYYHYDHESVEYPLNTQDLFMEYTTRHKMFPNTSKEISNILKKLHDLFSRYNRQKEDLEMVVQVPNISKTDEIYLGKNLTCRR